MNIYISSCANEQENRNEREIVTDGNRRRRVARQRIERQSLASM